MAWFYNKSINIYQESEGYLDRGSWVNGELEKVTSISCDIQPSSRDQIYKEYGYYVDCSKRVFCDLSKYMITGAIIEYEGERYKIVKTVEWDDYIDAFMELDKNG